MNAARPTDANKDSSLMKKITPKCENMSKQSKILNVVCFALLLLSLVFLIVVLVYNYMPVTTDQAELDSRKTIKGTVSILAVVSVTAAALISLWNVMITGQVNKCIMGTATDEKMK